MKTITHKLAVKLKINTKKNSDLAFLGVCSCSSDEVVISANPALFDSQTGCFQMFCSLFTSSLKSSGRLKKSRTAVPDYPGRARFKSRQKENTYDSHYGVARKAFAHRFYDNRRTI